MDRINCPPNHAHKLKGLFEQLEFKTYYIPELFILINEQL